MPDPKSIHYDLDRLDQMMASFDADDISGDTRRRIAEHIVVTIQNNALLNELRCLRGRALSPCPDPSGHTHRM